MTVIKLAQFAGQTPKFDRHVLPDSGAVQSTNVDLRAGVLTPVKTPKLTVAYSSATPGIVSTVSKRLFEMSRVSTGQRYWLMFPHRFAHVERTPVLEDSFERVYFTCPGYPLRYATDEDLFAGDASKIYPVGIDQGPNFTVAATGGTGSDVTRSYVSVYASAYGEHGEESGPEVTVGKADGTWTVSGYPTTSPGANYKQLKFYRASVSSGTYRLVRTLTLPATSIPSFVDNVSEATLTTNEPMPTTVFGEPPANLQGLVLHPNGFFAGFVGRDVYMSVPYVPHAWPAQNVMRMRHPVVKLVIIGESIAVLTKGSPALLIGMSPETMQKQSFTSPLPCIAECSAIVYNGACIYAAPDGLCQLTHGGPEIITTGTIDREDWLRDWVNADIDAILWDGTYLALSASSTGFMCSLEPPLFGLNRLSFRRPYDQITVGQESGRVLLTRAGNIEQWMPSTEDTAPLEMFWSSKTWTMPKPMNFGAFQIKRTEEVRTFEVDPLYAEFTAYNASRLAAGPLDVINGYAIGGQAILPVAQDYEFPPSQPSGGEPLFDTSQLSSDSIRMRIISDGIIMFDAPVNTETTYRIRHGYKGTRWSFELSSFTTISAIHLAGTPLELARA